MTPNMQKKYLKDKGAICPFCGSHEIEASSFEVEENGTASQRVYCNGCDRSWDDLYTLTGAEEIL
jgi:hypothetical protein